MKGKQETKGQLVNELRSLRKRIAKLEASGAAHERTGEELRESYVELRESKDELVRSEKLAFTGRIAANIAHELRNPLTNVAISVEQLKKTIKPKDPIGEDLDIIERNTERANHLITELLNCARPPKLNIRFNDANRVLKNALESARTKIRSQKIHVVKKFASRKPAKIKMDKEQMERTFSNLITNAVEAMRKRGKLTIITELNKDFFAVKIQDNGRGIPAKDIIRIYDPFFSTKSSGVGLGLTLCYGIIVGHGGTIGVESKPRKGTVFTVSLPVTRH